MTTPQPEPAATHTVGIRRGSVYFSRELCDAHLSGIDAVALLDRDADLLVMPLRRQSAGGMLLKVRDARGDRVLHAQEFFRARGLAEDFQELLFPARWDAATSALAISGLPPLQT